MQRCRSCPALAARLVGAPRTDRDRSAHALCRIRELYVCQEL